VAPHHQGLVRTVHRPVGLALLLYDGPAAIRALSAAPAAQRRLVGSASKERYAHRADYYGQPVDSVPRLTRVPISREVQAQSLIDMGLPDRVHRQEGLRLRADAIDGRHLAACRLSADTAVVFEVVLHQVRDEHVDIADKKRMVAGCN